MVGGCLFSSSPGPRKDGITDRESLCSTSTAKVTDLGRSHTTLWKDTVCGEAIRDTKSILFLSDQRGCTLAGELDVTER